MSRKFYWVIFWYFGYSDVAVVWNLGDLGGD